MRGQFAPITISRGRRIASVGLALGHFVMAVAYQVPSLSISPSGTLPPGAVSIVNYIDAAGPWWVAGYGLTGLGILSAVWMQRCLHWAHALGAAVAGAFATASLVGAFSSDPNRPIIVGVAFAMVCVAHLGLFSSYGDLVEQR